MSRIVLFFIFCLVYHFLSISQLDNKQKVRRFLFFVSIPLILESAMRNLGVGSDTYQYYLRFEQTKYATFDSLCNQFISFEGKDIFYSLFQKTFQLVFPRYHLWLGFIAIVYFSSLALYLYRCKLSLIQLLVAYAFYLQFFYTFFSCTGLRQTLAVSCITLAYVSLLNKKNIYYIAFTILGLLFHVSAVISIMVLLLKRIKNVGFFVFLIPFMLPFLYMFGSQISRWFIVDTIFANRFGQYTIAAEDTGSLYVTSIYLIVFLGMYIFYNKLVMTEENNFNVQLYVACIILLPLMYVSNTAHRVSLYFSMSLFVLIPVILRYIRFQGRYALAIMFIMILTFIVVSKSRPYHFYWQIMELVDSEGNKLVLQEPLM